jgi:DHA2 family multidrug resistance protein-like MFS transporter
MGTAIGVWFTCFMGGMLVGPLIGGALLEHFWWGSAFLIGVPVMVVLMIAGPILLPEYRAPEPGRVDLASVALALGAILPVTWGLKEFARSGAAPLPFVAIAVGLALGVLFVRRQGRLADPLLDLALFRNRVFSTSIVMMLLGGVVMAGISLVSAIYIQSALGLPPFVAGLWLIPQSVAMVIGFQVAPLLARRLPVQYVIAIGLGIGAIGFLLQTGLHGVDGPGLLVVGVSLSSFGITFPMALLTTLMLGATDPAKAGAASSVSETGGEFGIAVGIATLGSLATLVYRLQLGSAIPDAPEQALRSLAGALQVGGDELVAAARDAFTSGVVTVGVVGAVVFVAMAIVGLVVLRQPASAPADAASESVPESA